MTGPLLRYLGGRPLPAPNGPKQPLGEEAIRAVGAGLFRPSRPNAALVNAALAELPPDAEGLALWELLVGRGALPASWVDGAERGFAERPWLDVAFLTHHHRPRPSLAEAAALAADPEGVAEVESLAAEIRQRLFVYTPEATPGGPVEVAWQVLPVYDAPNMPQSNYLPGAGNVVFALTSTQAPARSAARAEEVRADRILQASLNEHLPRGHTQNLRLWGALSLNASRLVQCAALFALAQSEGWRVPHAATRAPHLRGLPFSSLPNPWEPLLWIYRRGYALRGFMDEDHLCPLLLAPPLNGTPEVPR